MAAVPRLSVVIPVYNERATIEELLKRVQAVPLDKEIVIVDDGSTDGTRELLAGLAAADGSVRVYLQPANRGKGAALRRGFAEARGALVPDQDADLEYDPTDYPTLPEPIERGVAAAVFGSRSPGRRHRALSFWHSVRNWV